MYKINTYNFLKQSTELGEDKLAADYASQKRCRRTKTTLGYPVHNPAFNIRKRVLANYRVRTCERSLSSYLNSLKIVKGINSMAQNRAGHYRDLKNTAELHVLNPTLSTKSSPTRERPKPSTHLHPSTTNTKSNAELHEAESSSFADASVNGRRIGGKQEAALSVTAETKRQIIQTMLKQGRIPLDMIPCYKDIVNSACTEKEKLVRMADSILESYDMMVQTVSKPHKSKTAAQIPAEAPVKPAKSPSLSLAPPKKPLQTDKLISSLAKLPPGMRKCSINETITLINKYCALAFKSAKQYGELKAINVLHRRLGLGKLIQSEEELRSRDRVSQLKESLLRVLYARVNRENAHAAEYSGAPRFCVEKGNNSALVKSLLRDRYWWVSSEVSQKAANFLWSPWKKSAFISALGTAEKPLSDLVTRISNHFEGNYYLGYKKNMYKCLLLYYSLIGKDISKVIPLTFHIKKGKADAEYAKFLAAYNDCKDSAESAANIWIIKPGENTNRGNGIVIASTLAEISSSVSDSLHTYIIQKYIERPLLFDSRKFDIRCFALLTSVNGYIKGYYYQEGYLRTSSKDYSVADFSSSVHLTNEAVQMRCEDFGKRESGNKVSYAEFHKHVANASKGTVDFSKHILPKIKVISIST